MTKSRLLMSSNNLILITGPSRSGKSEFAESLLKDCDVVTYIATSQIDPDDIDWQERIELHRIRRPNYWSLIESNGDLANELKEVSGKVKVIVDSLGGYISRHIELSDDDWSKLSKKLLTSISNRNQTTIFVIEECGWGIVPNTPAGCKFRDRIGLLSQEMQLIASQSWLVIQGRALDLKEIGRPIDE